MLLFLSDAHIGMGPPEDQEKRKKYLFECLDYYKPQLDKLFILGDLFDFWFEWRHVVLKRHFRVLCKLRELTSAGVELHYLAGNHDFALSDFLPDEIGAQVHSGEYHFIHEGKSFYIQHGDGIAPADWSYRILKRIFRNRFNQKLFSLLHPDVGVALAHTSSRTSRNYSGRRWDIDGWAYLEAAEKYIAQGNDYVVFAHNHEPMLQQVQSGIYVNTGDWMKYFSYGLFEDGVMKLKYWNQPYIERSQSRETSSPLAEK